MQKLIIVCSFLLVLSNSVAQNEAGFQIYSASGTIGGYFDKDTGGAAGGLDVVFDLNNNKFRFSAMGGSELKVNVLGPNRSDVFVEANLSYGRELSINDWLFAEFYGGLGYFYFKKANSENFEFTNYNTIGFPIDARIRFQLGANFGIGLQLHSNLNSASTIYYVGPFFQLKFN
ncbi:hypothetical protein [Ulvibacter antarcticus]|uniref:Outer membrane protein with beta-barrel domain n=1 Tax=Ulvibacter antarcticus TaxID=442714 RepID=A0A3L9YYG9_9FLAO|nr:hypothetical protein [Ulvibacter antarcticus]RMA65706.1 hypothetical protein BXY75_0118 [Ulvibacter antarcticus]